MKNRLGQEVCYLECACTAPVHQLRVVYDPGQARGIKPPTLSVDVQFPTLPLHKRIMVALLYVFGLQESWTSHRLTDTSVCKLGNDCGEVPTTQGLETRNECQEGS